MESRRWLLSNSPIFTIWYKGGNIIHVRNFTWASICRILFGSRYICSLARLLRMCTDLLILQLKNYFLETKDWVYSTNATLAFRISTQDKLPKFRTSTLECVSTICTLLIKLNNRNEARFLSDQVLSIWQHFSKLCEKYFLPSLNQDGLLLRRNQSEWKVLTLVECTSEILLSDE